MAERYVLLGVAGARSRWLGRIARWATSAALPVELVTALDAAEARAVLAAGRRVSALVADADGGAVDRDLVARAAHAGAVTFAVTSGRTLRDLDAVGVDAVLHDDFDAEELHDALRRHARRLDDGELRSRSIHRTAVLDGAVAPTPLVGVTGHGGAGASTVAMALAQGLAARGAGRVALVDGCRRADLAMYHDETDPVPGLPELLEIHRGDRPDPDDIRLLFRHVDGRGYHLLPGLRRPGDWGAHRRRTVEAAVDGLRRSHDVVVVDLEADLDDEDATGSVDVEDRHAVTLTVTTSADLLLVVGRGGVHGLHALVQHLRELRRCGVDPDRIVPVLNGAPRSPAARAVTTRSLHGLTVGPNGRPSATAPPLHLRDVPGLESAHRAAERLPGRLVDPVTAAVVGFLDRLGPTGTAGRVPGRVAPGSLGTAADHQERVA